MANGIRLKPGAENSVTFGHSIVHIELRTVLEIFVG
jgi:hypothetical protein